MSDKKVSREDFNAFATKEIIRLALLKEKLTRESVNFATSVCMKRFGNASLVSVTEDLVENFSENKPNSYTGSVKVTLKVAYGEGPHLIEMPVEINEETPVLPEDFSLDEISEEAPLVEGDDGVSSATVLTNIPMLARLDSFRLVDDGSSMLKVYHPSLDMGSKEIGVISKIEYLGASNKEALLKEVFEDIVANSEIAKTHELRFEGSFVEPTIQKTADVPETETLPENMCECVDYNCPSHLRGVCSKPATQHLQSPDDIDGLVYNFCDDCARDAAESGTLGLDRPEDEEVSEDEILEDIRFRMPDFRRQLEESLEQRVSSQESRITIVAANAVVEHLNKMHFNGVKIMAIDKSKLSYNSETSSFDGTLHMTASLTGAAGERIISLPLSVKRNAFKMPSSHEIHAAIKAGVDPRKEVEQAIAKETAELMAKVDEKEQIKEAALQEILTIQKTAADQNVTQYIGHNTTMHLNKHLLGLPDDMELGTVIYADGAHWKLINKNHNQLSKGEGDGSIWTFTSVSPEGKLPEFETKN